MKFSGDMGMDISCTEKYIVTLEINQCSFSMVTCFNILSILLLIVTQLKNYSIFMKLALEMDMVYSYT